MIRSGRATCAGSRPWLQGDWGFSFASRINVDTLILQRPADDAVRHRLGAAAGDPDRDSGRRLCGDAALFDLRPDLPAPWPSSASRCRPSSPGCCFILVFSVQLDWLPFVYRADIGADRLALVLGAFPAVDHADHRCSASRQAASMTRYVRSAVLDVIRLDYVTTARAKGLGERVVIVKHVVRNALIPVVTLVALQMPAIFGGAIVTEQIFRIPGIGSLLISAILANDTPVIMAVHLRVRLPRRRCSTSSRTSSMDGSIPASRFG